ncbi:MAG: autotransporter domain-containing protein [Pontiella sp.]
MTNYVSGTAFGTNYSTLATQSSISSIANGPGLLLIEYSGTTNLTLSHNIQGLISVSNSTPDFVINATGSSISNSYIYALGVSNATNMMIKGGRFIGTSGTVSGFPPLPGDVDIEGITSSAVGGTFLNSSVTISGSEFRGSGSNEGLLMEQSELIVSNGTFHGGETGAGLVAFNNSSVTIYDGSFTGGVGNTAFYLENSDATVYDGTFGGNINGTTNIAGSGLFSLATGTTTNQVALYGGDFSSLAFFGTTGAVHNFYAGTNLTVQNGVIQNGGKVIVDNQDIDAFDDVIVFSGTMQFSNTFSLASGGNFSLFGVDSAAEFTDLDISSNASFNVSNGKLSADTLSIHESGNLNFWIFNGTNGSATADTAYIHTNASMFVDATASGYAAGANSVILLSTTASNELFVVGETFTNNATTGDFNTNNVEVAVAGRSRLKDIVVANSQDLILQFATDTLRDYWSATGPLAELGDEFDLIDNSTMMTIIDFIDDPALSGKLVEQTYFTTMNTFQSSLNALDSAVGQTTSRGTEFRDQLNLPTGPKGPEASSEIRGWAKYYGQYYSHDADGLNPEYDTSLNGGVVGVDKNFGRLLLGISGGGGRSSTRFDSDAEEDINAYYGSLYSTFGGEKAYLDGGIAYGRNQVKNKTASPFTLEGEFDADIVSAYLGVGYNLVDTKGGSIITPEIAVQYSSYKQDAYTETSTTAVPRSFDEFDADSLRSKLGINVAMLNTKALETFGFKLEGRLHWLHEFNPDPGSQSFQLEGGSGANFQISYPLLEEDMFRVGFSVSCFNTMRNKPKNVMLRLDLDEFFGENFISHNFAAKVVYAF